MEYPVPGAYEQAVLAELREVQVAKAIQAMVDGDDNNITAAREFRAVDAGRGCRSRGEAATVQIEHHRQFASGG